MNRKEIVKALEEYTGLKAKYMGAPSFAYQILIGEEIFTVDRVGRIITSAGLEVELGKLLNKPSKSDTMEVEDITKANEPLEFEVCLPMAGHTGTTLRNLVNMIYSKQVLIKKTFELQEDIVDATFIANINSKGVQTLEEFETVVTEKDTSSWRWIEFDFTSATIIFRFGTNLLESEKLKAYTEFISLLNKSAKAQKYASPKPVATDNDKFTMRTWLIRLGFVGDEYKASRKSLVKNLEGDGAFRRKPSTEDDLL